MISSIFAGVILSEAKNPIRTDNCFPYRMTQRKNLNTIAH